MLHSALQIKNPAEIPLFREMIKYFKNTYPQNVVTIEEKHKHIVIFDCYDPNHPQNQFSNIHKEISDLLIITYSANKKQARATFLQAKWKATCLNPFRFRGDVFQYLLLNQRPLFAHIKAPSSQDSILHNAILDSIGSYGVFYQKTTKDIEFAFAAAQEISLYSSLPFSKKNKGRVFKILSTVKKVSIITHLGYLCYDTRVLYGADDFEQALLSFSVGSPIDLVQLSNLLSPYLANSPELTKTFQDMSLVYVENGVKLANNILIINIDEL